MSPDRFLARMSEISVNYYIFKMLIYFTNFLPVELYTEAQASWIPSRPCS